MARGVFPHGILLERLLQAAHAGLVRYSQPTAPTRLAFRELGLAIGLAGIERLQKLSDEGRLPFGSEKLRAQVHALGPYVGLRAAIASSWQDPEQQRVRTWSEHRNINEVMLATSLVSDGFLVLVACSDRRSG